VKNAARAARLPVTSPAMRLTMRLAGHLATRPAMRLAVRPAMRPATHRVPPGRGRAVSTAVPRATQGLAPRKAPRVTLAIGTDATTRVLRLAIATPVRRAKSRVPRSRSAA